MNRSTCARRGRALVLVLKGVAAAEEHANSQVHSARQAINVPSVIRPCLEYRRIPHQTRALSRKNICDAGIVTPASIATRRLIPAS